MKRLFRTQLVVYDARQFRRFGLVGILKAERSTKRIITEL